MKRFSWNNRKASLGIPLFVIASVLGSSHVHAHASFEKKSAPAGSYQRLALAIPHGCGDKATNKVTIYIPNDITLVRPQPKPGWTLTLKKSGDSIQYMQWSGGELASDFFDEFKFITKLPNRSGRVHFKVTQTCGDEEVNWFSTGNNKRPVPSIQLTLSSKSKSHH